MNRKCSLVVIFFAMAFSGLPCAAQNGVATEKQQSVNGSVTATVPEVDLSLKAKMRDEQWALVKNRMEEQTLQARWGVLSADDAKHSASLATAGADAVKKAGLDPSKWHVNFDTTTFEKTPEQTPAKK